MNTTMNNIINIISLATTLITPIGTIAETVDDDLYVQIPVGDYVILTNQIHAMWVQANSTESGRVGIHGHRVGRVIDADNKKITLEYADGYRHVSEMSVKDLRQFVPDLFTNRNATVSNPIKRTRPRRMSDAQWEFIQKTDAMRSKRENSEKK
jgi:hypothetical protein